MLLGNVALPLLALSAAGSSSDTTVTSLWATGVASACFRDPEPPPATLQPKDKFFKTITATLGRHKLNLW